MMREKNQLIEAETVSACVSAVIVRLSARFCTGSGVLGIVTKIIARPTMMTAASAMNFTAILCDICFTSFPQIICSVLIMDAFSSAET